MINVYTLNDPEDRVELCEYIHARFPFGSCVTRIKYGDKAPKYPGAYITYIDISGNEIPPGQIRFVYYLENIVKVPAPWGMTKEILRVLALMMDDTSKRSDGRNLFRRIVNRRMHHMRLLILKQVGDLHRDVLQLIAHGMVYSN